MTFDLDDPPCEISVRPGIARDAGRIDPRLLRAMTPVLTGDAPWPLTLLGGVGVGKTCAALCALDVCYASREYQVTAELVNRITEMRRGDNPAAERTFWMDWRERKLSVLDELGARERVTDAHYEIVKFAIDYRQDQPAIFISNLTAERIAEVYDDRIASRLESGTVIRMFDWPDRRLSA